MVKNHVYNESMDSPAPAQIQSVSTLDDLRHKIEGVVMPPELKQNTLEMIARLERLSNQGFFSEEYEKLSHYITWVSKVPWTNRVERPIDLTAIKATLDKNHYGMAEVKERILEYMSVLKLRSSKNLGVARAPIVCLVGLVGTGKTTFAYSLSEALGRPIARIPFGGLGSAKDLRGESRLHLEAEPGYIVRALCDTGVKNPIILLDEIDRVTEESRADIMGVLVEILDPSQNNRYLDHFIDYPVDLSEVMFIATANNTGNLATAVMDRLEPIQMPSYSDDEKTHIAQSYLFPKALEAAGMDPALITIDPALWPTIIRPLGYDAGIRTLNRTIEGIVRKVALLLVTGQAKSIALNPENIKSFLPKW
ncbi:MAG: Lon protease [Candidatus Collierbacteria bacterium GW2011_GWA1_42_60]|uniref:Lon protease n=1 Tax=Candidatus Collierbacteria bacterium GW2011_GWA2_42_17 TaxID=1618378 RepID=A0A0G1C175_9BACT|nr:MAG: Lon protease [Candidatus Collierbacteria bacterium GW2011_GWB2_42_12]KKS43378.1 MAG: Lon protease [Candidatus Collierbacteria bacterium GW2011_GWA2_42_17]KKS62690.1 MAG: Lon protease [Candidatus Collierbacteria bacterium GW2011_GWE2_42_48]KKS62964.1 MAG: Lon protease [Candidatus Collierbacteria bacterium GW2011_GWD2_42_50]KKS63157.1 MAG: Lon protease [Candidatus Collierbacteria bacterium GW2011_GWF1_42_50]KKS67046.1 MAG: Lon protease [Candidatus Collierbacteria bacterium GW2011_GWA1_42